jgi:hypothetical protein
MGTWEFDFVFFFFIFFRFALSLFHVSSLYLPDWRLKKKQQEKKKDRTAFVNYKKTNALIFMGTRHSTHTYTINRRTRNQILYLR